jgi:hypothetical protein
MRIIALAGVALLALSLTACSSPDYSEALTNCQFQIIDRAGDLTGISEEEIGAFYVRALEVCGDGLKEDPEAFLQTYGN